MPYKDPAAKKAQARRHYLANKEKYKEWREKWREANPEKHAEIIKQWHADNTDRVREIKLAWERRNPEYTRAASVEKRVKRVNRKPVWFSELDDLVAKEATALARRRTETTGFKWHVDHVIPLKGKLVSGLHVWNNLAVIPASVNQRKINKFPLSPLETSL